MDPQDFINHQDLSMSMLQPQPPTSPKKPKIHSSFSVSGKKNNVFDSFSYDTDQQPPTQNNSKEVSQSQSITQGSHSNLNKERMRDLFVLQEQLQKEFLMMMKEKQEKVKFLNEIEEQIKNYYALLIQAKQKNSLKQLISNSLSEQAKTQQPTYYTKNKIVPDNGFDNCYNFIKEVIITTSKNYDVAVTLLMNCTISYQKQEKGSIFVEDYLSLVDLFVNVFFEGVTETDPFLKDVTKLICCFLAKIPQLKQDEKQILLDSAKSTLQERGIPQIRTNFQKIVLIFNVYMQKQQVQDYFDILSNHMLKKIEKISFNRAQNRSRTGVSLHQSRSIIDTQGSIDLEKEFMDPGSSFGFKLQENWLEYLKPFETFNDQKRALAMSYLSQIYSEADLCPMNLKIVLKYFYESQFSHFLQKYPLKLKHQIKQLTYLKVWQLIERYYLKGFDESNQHKSMLYKQMPVPEVEILKDVVRMVRNFFGNRKEYQFFEDEQLLDVYRKSKKFIAKVVEKLLSFNQLKYSEFREKIEEYDLGMKETQLKKNQSEVYKPLTQLHTPTKSQVSTQKAIQTPTGYQQSSINPRIVTNTIEPLHHQAKAQLPPQLIRIYGGCISLKQLRILLTSLKRITPTIPNQRIINRVNRIFDMSPGLDFINQHKLVKHPNQVQHLYIIMTENQLDSLISNDYKKLYDKEYHEDKVKNMVRAVMCELKLKELSVRVNKRQIVNKKKVNIREFQLQDFKMFKKNKSPQKGKQCQSTPHAPVLMNLLQKISTQCSRSVQGTEVEFSLHKGVSIQLLKKIKYLLYLFQNKSSELNQSQVLKEMLQEVKLRSANMIQIYEHTKFGLLAATGNIRHYKNLLISKKEIQQKVNNRIKHIKLLENLHLNVCLTSPYTRSHPQFSLRDNSPSKQSSSIGSSSFISLESPRKPTSSSFNKQKPSTESDSSSKKDDPTKQPSTVFFQPYNKYKYRISNAEDIVFCETSQCIHKDNIFMGLSYHANTIQEFIEMFSNLREVGENIFFARCIVPEDVANKVYTEVVGKLKQLSPVNHTIANAYLSKKYQKLNYSIDKINSVLYEFIDYLMSEKLSKQIETKTNSLQLKRLIKEIIIRGIHQRLVKKIEKKIKVNVTTNQRNSLKKKQDFVQKNKNLINLQVRRNEADLLKGFEEDGEIYDYELVGNQQKKDEGSKSAQVDITDQIRNRELSRSSRKPKKQANTKQLLDQNSKKPQSQDPQIDQTIYQSRNDQILLLRMQRIRNSFHFESYHSKFSSHATTQSLEENDFNTKQLEQVCARYIKGINKKETPEEKIEMLRNVSEIYKLIVKEQKEEKVAIIGQNYLSEHHHHHHHHCNLEILIFRSLVIASPPNFITNLAFIEMFLHKDRMLSVEGKLLNQYKKITQHIFQMTDIHKYLNISPQMNIKDQTDAIDDPELKTAISKIRNRSMKECHLL